MQLNKDEREIEFEDNISELIAMKSNAGWYAGRIYLHEEEDYYEPHSRESGYFKTPQEVEDLIHYWGNDILPLR